MNKLWTLEEITKATAGAVVGAPARTLAGISIDSRTLQPGDAFFAIRGDVHDGHAFVADALAKGAGLAVVAAERLAALPADGPYVAVADVLEALRQLGTAARARTDARVIAITGSVGKTSTKEALRTVLARQGATHASVASYNNHWGVPLTLARMPAATRFGVFEIGMNHANEIRPLTRLVRPHVAVVTTVAAVHLENFESVEGIARAKAEIFEGLEPGGAAVIHRDVPYFSLLRDIARACGAAKVVSFGESEDADARLEQVVEHATGLTASASLHGRPIAFKLGAPGRHLATNALAVLAAAELVGADLALAALTLADVGAAKGRGERHRLAVGRGEAILIDESYNANPTSMRAAIALLGAAPVGTGGRRIAVLGDMLELGPEAPSLHAGLADPLTAARVDVVHCSGPLMRSLYEALPVGCRGAYAETSAQLAPILLADVGPGDAIMVKGSLGSRMGPLVEALRTRFPRESGEA